MNHRRILTIATLVALTTTLPVQASTGPPRAKSGTVNACPVVTIPVKTWVEPAGIVRNNIGVSHPRGGAYVTFYLYRKSRVVASQDVEHYQGDGNVLRQWTYTLPARGRYRVRTIITTLDGCRATYDRRVRWTR